MKHLYLIAFDGLPRGTRLCLCKSTRILDSSGDDIHIFEAIRQKAAPPECCPDCALILAKHYLND